MSKRKNAAHSEVLSGATFKPAANEGGARKAGRMHVINGHRVKVGQHAGKWGCWVWPKAKANCKKRNPADKAASLWEMFHGGESESETVVHDNVHYHEHLGELGILGGLKVRTVNGYDVTLEFMNDKASNPKRDVISKVGAKTKGWIGRRSKAISKLASGFGKAWLNPNKGPVILCSNEVGDSLYLRSGSQEIDLDKLHLGGEFKKDSVAIGEVWLLGYITEKSFDNWKELFYVHGLGDEAAHPKIGKKADLWDDAKPPEKLFCTGKLPMLIYDRLSQHLAFSGGVYKVKAEGIVD